MLTRDVFSTLSLSSLAAYACVLSVVYIACLSVYRLYLSPIAHFPGPKLAALTLWYEFYYDVVLVGRYQFKIKKLHEAYGAIVRITPFELHIDDPDFYDEIYVGSSVRRTDKYARSAHAFGGPRASFGTVDHHKHRLRRSPLNPFFSKRSVIELVPLVQAKIDKFNARLLGFKGTGAHIDLVYAFSALTVDIITEYAFARSFDNLDAPDFNPGWHHVIKDVSILYHVGKQFPVVPYVCIESEYTSEETSLLGDTQPPPPLLEYADPEIFQVAQALPDWVTKALNPQMMVFPYTMQLMQQSIEATRSDKSNHQTIFHSLLNDSGLPREEKTTQRLMDEGLSIVAAGSVTVAHALSRTTYELLSHRDILVELRSEMTTATSRMGRRLNLTQLEQLPYLNAVATEGLRITYGVSQRLMRVAPDEAIKYKSWTIPAGTPVGMSSMLMHDNPDVFPEPRRFIPERWLDPADRRKNEKYFVTFSRGTRNCLGMNLAYAEIFLTLYALFGPSGVGEKMELFETDISDLEVEHDCFNPLPAKTSRGLRVLIQ